MANSVDANNLFSKCMNELTTEKLTATTVADYVTSPFSIHCNRFVSKEEQDPITEYQKLLFQRGRDHENQTVREKFPEMSEISFDTPENGFKSTIDAMVSGKDTLHGMPIYYLPEGIYGITDLLEKSDSAGSIFGNYHQGQSFDSGCVLQLSHRANTKLYSQNLCDDKWGWGGIHTRVLGV